MLKAKKAIQPPKSPEKQRPKKKKNNRVNCYDMWLKYKKTPKITAPNPGGNLAQRVVNLGAFATLIPYLTQMEVLQLQLVSLWFYHVCIEGAQQRLVHRPHLIYFADRSNILSVNLETLQTQRFAGFSQAD